MSQRAISGAAHILVRAAAVTVLGCSACSVSATGGNDVCEESPLILDVRESGSLRVIVRLTGEFPAESELDSAQVEAQRRRIADLQDRVIAGLDTTRVQVIRRFEEMPLLVLVVDEPTLCHLLESDLVATVQPDRPEPPG